MILSCLLLALQAPSDLLRFSLAEWAKTPEMRIEDAYKWLYHATRGGEHAVTDEQGPREWMDKEWASLGKPLKDEPEAVKLRPDGKIIRVNLRPLKAKGCEKAMLLAIFVESARRFRSDQKDFQFEWESLGQVLKKGPRKKLTLAEWTRLDKQTRAKGFPAIHHSQAYERAYAPAYRVVLGELWDVGRG